MRSAASIVTGLVLLVSLARCQGSRAKNTTNESDWNRKNALFEKANATVKHTISGYNVQKNFPGSSSSSWEAFADVRADLTDEEYVTSGNSVGPLGLLQRVGFRPTGDLLGDDGSIRGGDDWGFCMITQSLVGLNLPIDRDINPSCEGVFTKQCLQWLQDFAKKGKACSRVEEPDDFYNWADSPCTDYRRKAIPGGIYANMQPSKYGNVSDLNRRGEGLTLIREQVEKQDIPYYVPDLMQYYEAINTVTLMIIGWTPGPLDVGFSGADDVEQVPDSMVCLRTEKFAKGSKTFKDGVLRKEDEQTSSDTDSKSDGSQNEESDRDQKGSNEDDESSALGDTESRTGIHLMGVVVAVHMLSFFGRL